MSRGRVVAGVAALAVAVLGFPLLAWGLVAAAGISARMYPAVAWLREPVLTLSLAFCACGMVAALAAGAAVTAPSGRRRRGGSAIAGIACLAMAGLLVAIELLTASADATPPAFFLTGWGSAVVLAALGVIVLAIAAARPGPDQPMIPAARAGSA